VTVKLSDPSVLLEPDQSPLAEQLDALLDDQVKVTLSLTLVEEGSNDKVTLTVGVGAGASPEEPPPPHPATRTRESRTNHHPNRGRLEASNRVVLITNLPKSAAITGLIEFKLWFSRFLRLHLN
jgi:hypothetical protein